MKGLADFVFEIGCEEIPAGMLARATSDLKAIIEKHLASAGLLAGPLETYGGPRRLAALSSSLRGRQEDVVREVTGPPKSVAYDSAGAPTRAAVSFAEKQGVPLGKIQIVNTPKGDYLAVKKVIAGRSAAQLLAEILPQVLREIAFARSMYWTGADGPRFVRPIRWILALLDGRTIPFTFAGLASGAVTTGHRFLGKREIRISGTRDYAARLERNFVITDAEKRRKKILAGIQRETARKGWRAHEDPDLLETVTYLNEYPSVILGDFDAEYLELPSEILVTVMRDHQKYFAMEDKHGNLLPHFLAVINLDKDRKGLIRAGNERVLRARFADARFFWNADQKIPLGHYLEKLATVTYERRLGSYGDKAARLQWLARWIADQWFGSGIHEASAGSAVRAAELAKCDLVTEMVREFTELQGVVGGLYAHAQGEPEDVAWAIYDQYRPVGLDEPIPRNVAGCIVALADKLDSLVACFSVGAVPTGSSDPFALRRAAMGVVKIILERKYPLSLPAAVASAARALAQHAPRIAGKPEAEKQVLAFLWERTRYVMRERHGFAYDEVNAAMAAGADDLADLAERVKALHAIRNTRNFMPLAISFKRIRKILEKAGISRAAGVPRPAVRTELFRENAEQELHQAARIATEKAAAHKRAGHYQKALEAIADVRPHVDRFFDDVMVMAEEEELRTNRLALLAGLLSEFSTIADFSEVVAEEPR